MIGRYAIEGVLGGGTMGMIYRAHDPDIDRPVAIKLIRADLLESADRDSFVARFRREAQAAGRCTHPNIVAVYDFALHEGNPFIAMEFVDGVTLAKELEGERRYATAEAVPIMLQLLAALEAAHGLGVVHRDIKPANIMLVRGSLVKVADFGISRVDSSSLTGDGSMIGTPSYMSPEQCRGETIDARSDLFSAGVVLFELLAGRKPFVGRNMAEVLNKLLHEEAPAIGTLCPGLPPAIAAVVTRSLSKTASDRFASATAMAAALRDAVVPGGATATAAAVQVAVPFDRTIVAPRQAATGFDDGVLATVERRLTTYVGPVAHYLMKNAVRNADSIEGLCDTLAGSIDHLGNRALFQQDVRRAIGGTLPAATITQSSTTPSVVAQADIDTAITELARHIGPVARVLVKRAMPQSRSATELWRNLAPHIDDTVARTDFLIKAPRDR